MPGSLLSQADIAAVLRSVGLTAGNGVFVHAAMGGIGPIIGGARAIVAALIDVVGPEGLIAMPGFCSDAYMPEEALLAGLTAAQRDAAAEAVLGFDLARSSCKEMGAVAETFRTWPGVRRSGHPCVSVTAWGPEAETYLAEHALAWACGPRSPLGKFSDRPGMKILLIGVGWNRCSALHTAETLVQKRRTKIRRCKHDGIWQETPDVADDLNRLFPSLGAAFETSGAVSFGNLGGAALRQCGYADLIGFATSWFERHLPDPS